LADVATFGDSQRSSYRGRRQSAAVLALVCLLAALTCQLGSAPAHASESASSTKPASSEKTWCVTKPNATWGSILDGSLVALSRRASIVPVALANDERSFFAEIYTKSYSGIVRIDARSSRYTKIKRFTEPENDQAVGKFDGRWLVWAEFHSMRDPNEFSIWSWDLRTQRLRQLGAATRSPSGDFWPSSWQAPDAFGGYATWQQGTGPNGRAEIHLVDLATGRDRIIRRGHPGGPFFVSGPRVIWPESMKLNAQTVMRAADVRTGRIVATPSALRHLRGGSWSASNGKSLMYATDGQKSLWWSPSLDVLPRRVYTTRHYQLVSVPLAEAWSRYTSFSVPHKTFVVDTVAGRYVRIYPGGWAIVGPKALVLLTPSKKKANHAITDIFFVPLKSLPPVPPCP
jgi:hypothetical protein